MVRKCWIQGLAFRKRQIPSETPSKGILFLESLDRFEAYYTRHELPAFERLWRWSKNGNKRIDFKPRDEEDFSDELARWLRDDLQSRGVIVGREVQIERRQKTDVWVNAVVSAMTLKIN